MTQDIIELDLNRPVERAEWQGLLTKLGLHNFSHHEVAQIDFTLGLYEDGELVGTGSAAGNILKYIGVCNQASQPGVRFNRIVSALIDRLFQEQRFHLLVFTKAQYSASFQHVGFKELAHSDQAAILENGTPDIADYLQQIPTTSKQANQRVAAIVMNANPFTKGHRYLVDQAAQANDLVYVLVVETDASLFTTEERLQLVRQGTADLANVVVISGGDYAVSYATFPAYFLDSPDSAIEAQTTLDARIFKNYLAPALNITTRYLGSEPTSRTTAIYNDILKRELSPSITVEVIERKLAVARPISARDVRQLIKTGDLTALDQLVPPTTAQLIKQRLPQLQARIQKGMKINGN